MQLSPETLEACRLGVADRIWGKIVQAMDDSPGWSKLTDEEREALSKLAREIGLLLVR